jgi:hypothetical protein
MNKLLQVIADKELNRAILADQEDKAKLIVGLSPADIQV